MPTLSSTVPNRRSWTRPAYDTVNNTVDFYFANPECCAGTFSNSIDSYTTTNPSAPWNKLWTNGNTLASGGPADTSTAPSSKHPYHFFVWDSLRNGIWQGFGSAQIGGTTGNCGDCGVTDLYFFNASTKTWTMVCGYDGVSANNCPVLSPSINQIQETSAAYDATNDVIVIYGGLVGGTPVATLWTFKPASGVPTYGSGTWATKCTNCAPGALHKVGMTPIGNGKIVIFGGNSGANSISPTNAAWVLDVTAGYTFTAVSSALNPPADTFPVMDWVPSLNSVVLIDVENPSHVLALNVTTLQWSDLGIPSGPTFAGCPDPFSCKAGVYDPSAKSFVLMINSGTNPSTHIWQLTLPNLFSTITGTTLSMGAKVQ